MNVAAAVAESPRPRGGSRSFSLDLAGAQEAFRRYRRRYARVTGAKLISAVRRLSRSLIAPSTHRKESKMPDDRQDATDFTKAVNDELLRLLPFEDRQDFEDAAPGPIADIRGGVED